MRTTKKNNKIISLKKVSNPYFFNIDGYVVKFSYQENGVEAEECIHNAIKQIINK